MPRKIDDYYYDAKDKDWKAASTDIFSGASRWRVWLDMSVRQFRNRYLGTIIGPFWLTFTTLMTTLGLGILYGKLFGAPLKTHLPYVCVALVVWSQVTGLLTNGASVFVNNKNTIQEYPLPYSFYAFKLLTSQFIAFGFRVLVLLGLFLVLQVPVTLLSSLAFIGLFLIFWIGFWSTLCLGILCTRYRYLSELITASMTFIFFVTPSFWYPDRLGEFAFIANYNPFYHLIEIVRSPLLGRPGIGLNYAVACGIAIIVCPLGFYLLGRYRHRLIYWF